MHDEDQLDGVSQQPDPTGAASLPCSRHSAPFLPRGSWQGLGESSSLVLTSPKCTHLGSLCSTPLRWDQTLFMGSSHRVRSSWGLLVADSCVLLQDARMVSTKPHTECFGCAEQSGVGGPLGLQEIEGFFFFLTPTALTCGMGWRLCAGTCCGRCPQLPA